MLISIPVETFFLLFLSLFSLIQSVFVQRLKIECVLLKDFLSFGFRFRICRNI